MSPKKILFLFFFLFSIAAFSQQKNDYFSKGVSFYQARQYNEAILNFKKSASIEAENKNDSILLLSWYYIAYTFYTTSQFDSSRSYFNKMQLKYEGMNRPEFISFNLSNIAMVSMAQQKYTDAIAAYKKALAVAEKNNISNQIPYMYYNMALCYHYSGKRNEAIENYENTIKYGAGVQGFEAQLAQANYNIGYIYYGEKNYEKTVEYYLNSTVFDNSSNNKGELGAKYNNIGMVYFDWGKYDKAVEYYENAISLIDTVEYKSDLGTMYYNTGLAYDSLHNFEKTIYYFERSLLADKAMSIDSSIATKENNIGRTYVDAGNYSKAVEYYLMAIRDFKKDSANLFITYENLAIAYEQLNDYKKTAEYYKKSIDSRGLYHKENLSNKYNNIGKALYHLGQFEESLIYFNKSIAISEKEGDEEEVAVTLDNIGLLYRKKGDNKKALEYHQKALDIDLRKKNTSHEAICRSNLGLAYNSLGEYDKALQYLTQALEIDKKNNKTSSLAIRNNNIGLVYYAYGRFQQALDYFKFALSENNKTENILRSGPSVVTQRSAYLNDIGLCYDKLGMYNEAIRCFSEAMQLDSITGNEPAFAQNINCTGMIYYNWGQYDKAISYYNRALEIDKRLGLEADVSLVMSNIGSVYLSWGLTEKALDYFIESAETDRKSGSNDLISKKYNNIATAYHAMGKDEKALEFHQRALELDIKMGKDAEKATDLNNMGLIYLAQHDYEKAKQFFEQSYDLDSKAGREAETAASLNNIGLVYDAWTLPEKALEYFNRSLEIHRKLGRMPDVALSYNNIATIFQYTKQYPKAIDNFSKAVEIYERLRKTAPAGLRKEYMENVLSTYRELTLCYVLNDDVDNAFKTIELTKSKELAESIVKSDTTASFPSLKELMTNIKPDVCYIVFANTENPLISQLLIKKDSNFHALLNKKFLIDTVLATMNEDMMRRINNAYTPAEIIVMNTYLKKQSAENVTDRDIEQKLFIDIIKYYRELISVPFSYEKENISKLQGIFYYFFLSTYEKSFAGVKHLILLTDGILGFLPFETLKDKNDKYLVETYDVSYIQSFSVMKLLEKREYQNNRKPMLAIGGAVYDEKTYLADMKDVKLKKSNEEGALAMKGGNIASLNEAQITYIVKSVEFAEESKRPMSAEYNALGIKNWVNLSGSLAEVYALAAIVKPIDTLIGTNVNETNIKNLSANGALKNYQVIHFSTHGIAVPEMPSLSAIVLSQFLDSSLQYGEDGYLRSSEIAELKLNADFVDLSACETGLGKIYSSEGVVGLTQSFLIAGANGISVSLWEVSDNSTAQFMVELYKIKQERNISYEQALNEVKRKFIKKEMDPEWNVPFFWAPFVYYGRE